MRKALLLAAVAALALPGCEPQRTGAGPTVSAPPAAVARQEPGIAGVVLKDVNVRAEPTTAAPVLQTATAGQPVTMLEARDDWYRVAVAGGTGWVRGDFVGAEPGASGMPAIVRSRCNVRAGAGTDQRKLGMLDAGAPVLLRERDADWYRVSYADGAKEGWVSAGFVTAEISVAAAPAPAAVAAPQPAPAAAGDAQAPAAAIAGLLGALSGMAGGGNGPQPQQRTQQQATGGNPFLGMMAALSGAPGEPARPAAGGAGSASASLFGGGTAQDAKTAGQADDSLPVTSLVESIFSDEGSNLSFAQKADYFVHYVHVGTINLLKALSNMHDALGNKAEADQIRAQAAYLAQAGTQATTEDYKKVFATINESSIDREQLAQVPAGKGSEKMALSWVRLGLAINADIRAFRMAQGMTRVNNWLEVVAGLDRIQPVLELGIGGLPTHIEKATTWMAAIGDYMSSNDIPQPSIEERKRIAVEDGGVTAEDADSLLGG